MDKRSHCLHILVITTTNTTIAIIKSSILIYWILELKLNTTSVMSVRFAEESTRTQPPLKLTTPSNAAKIALTSSIAALHQHLRDNERITSLIDHILQLFFLLHSKEASILKFEDPTYVPTSTRFKVEIRGTTRVQDNEEFKKIKEDAKADLEGFCKVMALHMKNAATIECSMLRLELMQKTVKLTDLIVKQQLLISEHVCRGHEKSNQLTIKVIENDTDLEYLFFLTTIF